jgi:hypothetical protein
MKFNKADIVMLKGRPEPLGVITKFYKKYIFVLWWPTSTEAQHKTFLKPDRLELIESSQKKRGRPPKVSKG